MEFETQEMIVWEILVAGRSITQKEALDGYGIGHLPKVIHRLRRRVGSDSIVTESVQFKRRRGGYGAFGRYRLAPGYDRRKKRLPEARG